MPISPLVKSKKNVYTKQYSIINHPFLLHDHESKNEKKCKFLLLCLLITFLGKLFQNEREIMRF
jgi:hypothetical protein